MNLNTTVKAAIPDAIAAVGLCAGYGRQTVVDGVSFTVPTGQMTALVGPNGSGKSTLLATLSRLLRPTGGQVLLDGKAIHQLPTRSVARRLGLLPQNPLLPEGLTVFELIARGRYPHQGVLRQWSDADERAVANAMLVTNTAEFAERQVDTLSGGQRQRCWIAMVLAQETDIILLDEPTSFLDLRYQAEILQLLHDLTRYHQRTVVVVLHDLNFAVDYADMLIFLKKGRICGIGDGDGLCTPALIQQVFDIEVVMGRHPHSGRPFFMPARSSRQRGGR